MSDYKYDYFLAGRWRNYSEIEKVLDDLRVADKKVYCFLDNSYQGNNIEIGSGTPEAIEKKMQNLEAVADWQTNPTFKKIYEKDMDGLKDSETFILVFPAGLSAHMELGVAFGLGKKCYGIGKPDKAETLYLMFDDIVSNVDQLLGITNGEKS